MKDILIELHTLKEMTDTLILPAAYSYFGALASSAAEGKAAGITELPQLDRANEIGALAKELKANRDALAAVIEEAESMHADVADCAALLTGAGAQRIADVRRVSDALEILVADDHWPLPKYREMLFPV